MKSIKLNELIEDLKLEKIYISDNYKDVEIHSGELNRPGLQFTGFYETFSFERLQIIGEQEWYFLDSLSSDERCEVIKKFLSYKIPALIFSGNHWIHDEILSCARERNISILKTKHSVSKFSSILQNYTAVEFAPTIRKHGVLLDVYGVGVLITGKSGIGKSEAALDLITKGAAKLISDDSVIIKQVEDKLIGSSPEITQYFMEIRGVGIIDIQKLFGIGYIMEEKNIEMIVNLEDWDVKKEYERLGLDNEFEEILGQEIVKYTIPVKPGRHIGLIIEVATKNFKQKEMGYNAAVELNERILKEAMRRRSK